MEIQTLVTRQLIAEYVRKGAWLGHPLIEEFDLKVAAHPDKVAIIDRGKKLTYAEVSHLSKKLAATFLKHGLEKGNVVACQLPNWSEYIFSFLASLSLGLFFVPILPHYRRKEVEHILSFTETKAIIAPHFWGGFDFSELFKGLQDKLPYLKLVFIVGEDSPLGTISLTQSLIQAQKERNVVELGRMRSDPNQPAIIVFTSGTEALPKGVMLTSNMLWSLATNICQKRRATQNDVVLLAVPLTHAYGTQSGLVAPLIVLGATLILQERFDATDMVKTIEEERVTQIVASPAVLKSLADLPNLNQYDIPVGCHAISGGDACVPTTIKKLLAKGMRLSICYGASEGLATETEPSDPPEAHLETVGRPHIHDEMRIVDTQGYKVKAGQIGRIGFRGPNRFGGYFKDRQRTQAVLDGDGFCYVGDLGYFDTNGRLRVVGREKEIIIRGGENISPVEIEELLSAHPKVSDVAIIGMPDTRLRERVCAYVVPKPGTRVELAELVSFIRGKVATFKLPERLEIIERIPRGALGKIQRSILVEDIRGKLQAK